MGLEEVLGGPVGVHPGHHEEPVVVRGLRQLAEEIALAQKLRAVVQRKLARIVRNDAAGIDDDGLHLCPLPLPRHQAMS